MRSDGPSAGGGGWRRIWRRARWRRRPGRADQRRRPGQRRRQQLRTGAPRRRHPVRRRRHLRVFAEQRLRDRRARRHGAVAVLLEDEGRHEPADARSRDVAQLHLFRAERRLGGVPRREDRQGDLEARDCAVRSAVLLVERADGHQGPCPRRHRQRPRRAGVPEVTRSAHRRGAVDSLLDAAESRRTRARHLGQSRRRPPRQRRHLDPRLLRSRDQPVHLRHRQPHARLHAGTRRGGQPVHVFAARGGRRYRQDQAVLPDVAARHPRLGLDADADSRGHAVQRPDAQAGDDRDAQRLFLRARPHQRPAPAHDAGWAS